MGENITRFWPVPCFLFSVQVWRFIVQLLKTSMPGNSIRSRAALIAAGFLILSALASLVIWRASGVLRSATRDVRLEHEVRFTVRRISTLSTSAFDVISSPAVFIHAVSFEGHLYIAGSAGLLDYDPSGSFLREYAVGRELPGSALVDLARAVPADSGEPELVLATASDGLVRFNGREFRQIVPEDPGSRAITRILPTASGHLIIGTKQRGILVYDGRRIAPFHSTLSNLYVTAIAGDEGELWVGTLDRGVLHYHAGETDSFGEEQGLPDRQVNALAILNGTTYVGTPLGVASFVSGRFSHVIASGVFATALVAIDQQLYIGSEDQGVLALPLGERRPNPDGGASAPSELSEVRQLFASGGSVFLLARNGLYRLEARGSAWQQVLQAGTAVLGDRNISALAADSTGRIWVGYFDRGLDVLASDSSHATHFEDEHLFCINRIVPDFKNGGVDVATANGLVRFADSGNVQQVLTRADGLIADHITDVTAYGDGLALATPSGLTFLDASGARSMYAFQGLANNHVYALAASGEDLLAGTLGGVSLLKNGNVAVSYTTFNSNLRHNWISAAVPVDGEWMVGTYGAGIMRLDRSGHFHSFDRGSGNFEVNPNAMLVTPTLVLAGTLGKGLYLYDRSSARWSIIAEGLPSLNVTALARGGGYIYIGTDNGLVRVAEQRLRS
jgi:ligand-binding sensor domain-containing protein